MYSNTFSLECLSTARMDAQIECSWNIFHWDWFSVSLLCTYISNEKTILPSSNQADVCDNVDWKLQFLQSFIYWPMYKFIWWFMDFQKNQIWQFLFFRWIHFLCFKTYKCDVLLFHILWLVQVLSWHWLWLQQSLVSLLKIRYAPS